MKIAIIGSEGFVGKACVHIFKDRADIIKVDPLLRTSVYSIDTPPDVALICVPTPMGEDGKINSSIVEEVIDGLSRFKDTLIVLKSTVLPDIVDEFSKYNKNFIYNPEFLTERNANNDAEYPFMTVLGGEKEAVDKMEQIYKKYSICEAAPFYKMSAKEASFVKYGINTFLATKVTFWNQFYDQVQKMGADYEAIKQAIGTDLRVAPSHMNVPGHSGKRGYNGSCFPKDTAAFAIFAKTFTVLNEAIDVNNGYLSQYELDFREKAQNVSYNIDIKELVK